MGSVAGRYESWFLSARDAEPGRPPRALWIRHTRHRAADAEHGIAARCGARSSTPPAGAPAAVKQSVRGAARPNGAGAHGFQRRGAGARADGRVGADADRRRRAAAPPAARARCTGSRCRETKLEAPVPGRDRQRARRARRRARRRRRLARDRRPQLGPRARRALGLAARRRLRGRARDVARARDRPRARRRRAHAVDRQRRGRPSAAGASGSAGSATSPGVRVVAAPGRLEAIVPGERVEIRVAVHADLDQTVGFKYAGVGADPARGDREVLHAGLAERPPRHPPARPQLGRAGHRGGRRLRARRPRASRTACRCSPTPDPCSAARSAGASARRRFAPA